MPPPGGHLSRRPRDCLAPFSQGARAAEATKYRPREQTSPSDAVIPSAGGDGTAQLGGASKGRDGQFPARPLLCGQEEPAEPDACSADGVAHKGGHRQKQKHARERRECAVTPATLDSAPIPRPYPVNLSPGMPCPHYTYYLTIWRLLLEDSKKKVKSRYGPSLVTGWELYGIGFAIRASACGPCKDPGGPVTCLHGATYSLSDDAPDWMPPIQGMS